MAANKYVPVDPFAPVSEHRCRDCPPDRVCAWACEQGLGVADILFAASLGIETHSGLEVEPVEQALWECYN